MIIAFAGRKQSGKTSSCEFVKNLFETSNLGQSKIYNFADPLKQVCIDILGLTYDQCYGTDENKNELVDCYWPGIDEQMTAREVMQHLGTDMFRRLQQNVWSAATIRLIEKEKPDLAIIVWSNMNRWEFLDDMRAWRSAVWVRFLFDKISLAISEKSETHFHPRMKLKQWEAIQGHSTQTRNMRYNLIYSLHYMLSTLTLLTQQVLKILRLLKIMNSY